MVIVLQGGQQEWYKKLNRAKELSALGTISILGAAGKDPRHQETSR